MYMHMRMYMLSITVSVKRTKTTLGNFSMRVYLEYKRKYTFMRTCKHTYFGGVSAAPRTEWTLWSTQQALQWGRELLSGAQRGVCSAEEALFLDSLLRSLAIQQLYHPFPYVHLCLSLFYNCSHFRLWMWTNPFINLCITFCVMDMNDTSNCGLMRKCLLLLFLVRLVIFAWQMIKPKKKNRIDQNQTWGSALFT